MDIEFVVVAAVVVENEAFLNDAQLTDSAIISDGGKVVLSSKLHYYKH